MTDTQETKEQKVYVVTRRNRRIEDKNYTDKAEAEQRAEALVAMLKKWNDPDLNKVRIEETTNPSRIR